MGRLQCLLYFWVDAVEVTFTSTKECSPRVGMTLSGSLLKKPILPMRGHSLEAICGEANPNCR